MKSLTPAKLSLILFLGVGLLVAGYFVKRMFATTEEVVQVNEIVIPMALTDIEPGTLITEKHIANGTVKAGNNLKRGTENPLRTDRVIVGRVAKQRITAYKPFYSSDLHAPGYRAPLDIAHGMRAVSLNLEDNADVVSGLIRKGGYVDVHMTINAPTEQPPVMDSGMTLTLFKGVKLLAVNSNSNDLTRINRVDNNVTLELTPAQANIIILSKARGRITLSHNPDGAGTGVVGISDENRATLDEILGLKKPEPPVKPEPPFTTEHFIGTGRRAINFRRDGNRIIRSGASYNGNNGFNNNDNMNQSPVRRSTFGGNTSSQGGQQNGSGNGQDAEVTGNRSQPTA